MLQKMMGLDNRIYTLNPAKGEIYNDENKSKLHKKAKALIKEIFPVLFISEEVSIQIDRKTHLYIDIYLPTIRTAIEVHGAQHVAYNKHFYKNIKSFMAAQGRDLLKSKWCKINDIKLIELFHNEDESEWRRKIRTIAG